MICVCHVKFSERKWKKHALKSPPFGLNLHTAEGIYVSITGLSDVAQRIEPFWNLEVEGIPAGAVITGNTFSTGLNSFLKMYAPYTRSTKEPICTIFLYKDKRFNVYFLFLPAE